MKKKILIIVESFGGGVFSFFVDLLKCIDNKYDIVIAYGKRKETAENFEEYFSNSIKFIEVKNFTRNINLKKDIKALLEIRKIVKREKPNIVHLHSSKAGILGRVGIHKKNIKMFYNPHGFSFLKLDESKSKRFFYRFVEKFAAILNRSCVIIGCSRGEYVEAKKLNKNSICIDNGIDLKKVNKETRSLKSKKIDLEDIKICTVGRIGNQKNPELFNEIAEKFSEIPFTWIGDGEQKDLLTAQNILVTGWLERNQVLEEINKNDIFILPSLWEGLPFSLLEAMYMKKICIVSNCIGNKDVINNGKNGYICSDLEDYIDIIKKILNGNIDFKITEVAYQDVCKYYNVKRMAKEYEKIYNN